MNFKNAKPGERYNVWIHKNLTNLSIDWFADYSSYPDYIKLPSTVFALYQSGYTNIPNLLLGWKDSEVAPKLSITNIAALRSVGSNLMPGYLDFILYPSMVAVSYDRWAELIDEDSAPVGKAAPIASGAFCVSCKAFNEYAAPTMGTNQYKCYSCRT